jgi:luciferase family oxidoreductase group 1
MVKLSVLDQSVATQGHGHDVSIRDTLAMAQHCDALGYHRFWVSEHHNHETIVGSAPEILVAAIAATTQRIRVGTAGVMLPHYAPYKVAEQFRVLEALAPGRIDLGVGRAPGGDRMTSYALNPHGDTSDQFPAEVRDMMAWVSGAPLPDAHPLKSVKAYPQTPGSPEVWMLGSSNYGAELGAYLGLPYCYAWFITDGRGAEEALEIYKRAYRPSARHPEPHVALCVWALAADTQAEAERLFATRARARVLRDRGQVAHLLPPDEAAAEPMSPTERQKIDALRANSIIGTGADVVQKLEALATRMGIQEIAILTWTHDVEARRRSYASIAEAAGLPRRA